MASQSKTPSTLPFFDGASADVRLGDVGIGRLPVKLWLRIFALGKCLDDTSLFAATAPGDNHINSVRAVSHVCSFFRQLAIESPILWTSIHIDDKSNPSDILRRIDRSRPLTLDIGIYLVDRNGVPASLDWKRVDAFMDIVIAEIGRWRSLRIRHGVERIGHPVVMRLHNRQALNLEHLSISLNAKEPGEALPAPHILNYGAPKLISAKLRGVAHTFYRPPLDDLTTLRLEGIGNLKMDFITFARILTQSLRLYHLMIRKDIVSPDVWELQSPESLPLKELRSLHMYSESGGMYAGFLLAMDAPQLSALTLEGVFGADLDPLCAQAKPEKFQTLSRLTLSTTEDGISSTTYVKLCRLFPNVTEYTTRQSTPSTSQLVDVLRMPLRDNEGPVLLWTKLHILRLAPDPSAESMDLIRHLLDTRISIMCPLGQVFFFRSEHSDWISDGDWSARLQTSVQLISHIDVLSGDSDYIDVDEEQV